ncbi:MAG: hypothetical protein MZU95_01265 [Desulfomicrobium escambiense]|nr:hypothetical protein [Desulfomicrobium escambiense]
MIRGVRTRWRWKVVLRSLTVLVGAGDRHRPARRRVRPRAVPLQPGRHRHRAHRDVSSALAGLGWFFFVRPLAPARQRPAGGALPGGARTVAPGAAAERGRCRLGRRDPRGTTGESAATARAARRSRRSRSARRPTWGAASSAAASGARSLACWAASPPRPRSIFTIGPAYLRQGALAVLVPVSGVEAASPYRIDVQPGDATVARGADVTVTAQLVGLHRHRGRPVHARPATARPSSGAAMIASGRRRRVRDACFFAPCASRSTTSSRRPACARRCSGSRRPSCRSSIGWRLEYVFPAYTGPRAAARSRTAATSRCCAARRSACACTRRWRRQAGRIVRGERDGAAADRERRRHARPAASRCSEDGIYRIDLATPGRQRS